MQVILCILSILGGFNRLNDLIQYIERLHQTFQHMRTILSLLKIKLSPMRDHFALMLNIGLQNRLDPELVWSLVHDRNHIEVIGYLQIGLLQQISENSIGIGILLELDDNTQTITSTLITHLGNTLDLFLQADIFHSCNKS
ncbi:hypothetical protein D1872_233990 [compost metagenome]